MFEPQAVPALALSASMQPDDMPQVTTPSLHAPPGLVLQTVPAAQVVHMPVLQNLSVPQVVPSDASVLSRHCGAPVLHAIAPFLHGLPELVEHGAPAAHGMQVAAALHTWPVPQLAPGLLVVPLVHAAGLQTVAPSAHGSLLVVQATPAVQVTQAPLMQSMLLPHGVPSRALSPSPQVLPSAPQVTRPSRQGAPGLDPQVSCVEQVAPSAPPSSRPEPTAASTMPPI
jgi:hypothetical protein